MTSKRKEQIFALLKGIETGDEAAVAVVNPEKYIQHNPQTHEGGEGLAALFKRLSEISPRVNIVRVFEDGNYVFAHTEYDFASSKIGFEIFRFEDVLAVEHWDNLQQRQRPNPSAHTMVDGPTKATDIAQTEPNREIVRSFVDEVLISGRLDKLEHYIDDECYTEHNPRKGHTDMIKLVMCLRRRPDMTREQFQGYWMNKHGPFFMKNAGNMRARKYVQSHTVDTPLNEGLRNSRGLRA